MIILKHALFQIIDGGIHVGQTLGIAGLHVLYDLVIVQTLVAAEVDVPAVSGTLTRLYRPYPLVVSVGEPVVASPSLSMVAVTPCNTEYSVCQRLLTVALNVASPNSSGYHM